MNICRNAEKFRAKKESMWTWNFSAMLHHWNILPLKQKDFHLWYKSCCLMRTVVDVIHHVLHKNHHVLVETLEVKESTLDILILCNYFNHFKGIFLYYLIFIFLITFRQIRMSKWKTPLRNDEKSFNQSLWFIIKDKFQLVKFDIDKWRFLII